MKYVIVSNLGCELPIIFHDIIDHVTVVGEQRVVAAGFVVIGKDDVECYGSSMTLRRLNEPCNSRGKEDADIIKQMLGL